jgi:hypothetical protein
MRLRGTFVLTFGLRSDEKPKTQRRKSVFHERHLFPQDSDTVFLL